MKTLSIRLPDELHADLRRIGREQKRPVSDLVRDCLRRYTAAAEFRALRSKMLPVAQARGVVTDEDVFKAMS